MNNISIFIKYILYISLVIFSIPIAFAEDAGFGGLGIQIAQDDDRIIILGVLPNTPAEKAELTSGTTIVAINGESTAGKSLEDIVHKLRGEVGSSVKLTILPAKAENVDALPKEIELYRGFIQVPISFLAQDTAPWNLPPAPDTIPIRGSVTFYINTIPKSGQIKIGTTTLVRLMLENPKGTYADKFAIHLQYDPVIFDGYNPLFDINTTLLPGWLQKTVIQDTTQGTIYFAYRSVYPRIIKSGCIAELRLIPKQPTLDTQINYIFNTWEQEPNTVFLFRGKDLLGNELDHKDGTMGVRLRINKE